MFLGDRLVTQVDFSEWLDGVVCRTMTNLAHTLLVEALSPLKVIGIILHCSTCLILCVFFSKYVSKLSLSQVFRFDIFILFNIF